MSRVEKDILVTGDICCVDPSPELYHVHNEVEIKHKWTEPVSPAGATEHFSVSQW